MDPQWGSSIQGLQNCHSISSTLQCTWKSSNHTSQLHSLIAQDSSTYRDNHHFVSVSLYNMNSWIEESHSFEPSCEISPIHYTFIESAETIAMNKRLMRSLHHLHFNESIMKTFYDGYSLVNPHSSVQYFETAVYLKDFQSLKYDKIYRNMIKGSSFVASNCYMSSSNRIRVILQMRQLDFLIDGLGACLTSESSKYELLYKKDDFEYNRLHKIEIISNYLFNMAFENTIEDGYVSEKVYDAILAGS